MWQGYMQMVTKWLSTSAIDSASPLKYFGNTTRIWQRTLGSAIMWPARAGIGIFTLMNHGWLQQWEVQWGGGLWDWIPTDSQSLSWLWLWILKARRDCISYDLCCSFCIGRTVRATYCHMIFRWHCNRGHTVCSFNSFQHDIAWHRDSVA